MQTLFNVFNVDRNITLGVVFIFVVFAQHSEMFERCPLYPQKRTFRDTSEIRFTLESGIPLELNR